MLGAQAHTLLQVGLAKDCRIDALSSAVEDERVARRAAEALLEDTTKKLHEEVDARQEEQQQFAEKLEQHTKQLQQVAVTSKPQRKWFWFF